VMSERPAMGQQRPGIGQRPRLPIPANSRTA